MRLLPSLGKIQLKNGKKMQIATYWMTSVEAKEYGMMMRFFKKTTDHK